MQVTKSVSSNSKNLSKAKINNAQINGKKPTPVLSMGPFTGEIIKAVQYDYNKVACGMWDFRIKFNKNEDPATYFNGVYRNGFISLLNSEGGFFKRYRPDASYFFLKSAERSRLIREVDPVQISDFISDYLSSKADDIAFEMKIGGYDLSFSVGLLLQQETIKKQCYSLFNKKFLEQLPNFEAEILRDSSTECYKPFANGVYKITNSGFQLIDYRDLSKFVWEKQKIDFNFCFNEGFRTCHFYHFVRNVSNGDSDPLRYKAFITAIGYLLHDFNLPEKGQAILLYDEVITDVKKPMGGSGKGVFAKALGKMSEMVKIDGKKFDEDNRFCFQRVSDSTQIVFFDDVKNKLGFDRFNSILTDGWDIEKKNKDEFQISAEDSPKVVITANSILDGEGTTRKRRQFILEFSDYYSKNIRKGNEEPIKNEHQCIFFSQDWDNMEWQMFYSFLIHCIQEYMKNGLLYYEPKNVKINRLRQVTSDDFAEWIQQQKFSERKHYETKKFYEMFIKIYYPNDENDEKFSQRKFTEWLKKYAVINDWQFKVFATHGISYFEFISSENKT